MSKTILLDPHQAVIKFPYSAALVAAVKDLPGRRYDPATKTWTVPVRAIERVRRFANQHGFEIVEAGTIPIGKKALPDKLGGSVTILGLKWSIEMGHNKAALAEIRAIPGREWHADEKRWLVPIPGHIDDINAFAKKYQMVLDPEDIERARGIEESALALADASRAVDAEIELPELPEGLAPYGFQRAGVAYAARARRMIIGDEMGLGKTIQAILAVLHDGQKGPVVCVVPNLVKINWKREWLTWAPHLQVQVMFGNKPGQISRMFPPDVVVINYDILGTGDLETGRVTGNLMDLVALEPRYLIVDESHLCKSEKAQRTTAVRVLAKHILKRHKHDAMVLELSGTFILNNADELPMQLDIIGRLHEFGGINRYRARYVKRSDNLVELNTRLRQICYLRRLKKDVLHDLPDKMRDLMVVETDPEAMKEYQKAEDDIVDFLAAKAEQLAIASGATSDEARRAYWEKAMRISGAEHLAQVNVLKRLAAKAKYKSVCKWIDEFLAQSTDRKIVVFAHSRDMVGQLADKYGGLKIQGGQNIETERQDAIDAFQNDPNSRVIVCSLMAGGVGITLTAASDVLFVEFGWNPGTHDQAEDRCHRIGQKDSVNAWYLLAQETIEPTILDLIETKRMVVDAATDGTEPEENVSVLGDLLVSLTQKGMGRRKAA